MRHKQSSMARPSSILLGSIFLAFSDLILAQTDNGNECSCFRTNASSAGYFSYHRFQDFRNIASAISAPLLIANEAATTSAVNTTSFFSSSQWAQDWSIQNWNNSDTLVSGDATVLMINSPNNVYIEKSADSDPTYSSYLTLRTARLPGFQSAAEVDSNLQNYHYMSMRFHARLTGSPGACAGIFTYLNSNPIQEADIEILTKDPRNAVQYTNQPTLDKNGNLITQASLNETIPGLRDWSDWNTYRVDWMPKQTSWYVNGISVANISFQVPRDPAGVIFNLWGDGGSWTGNMAVYDEAFLQIQWIESVYNTSGPAAGSGQKRDVLGVSGLLEKRKGTPGCKAVCSIDEEVNITGTPALLYNNTGNGISSREGMGLLTWLPLALALTAVFGVL